MGFQYRRIDFIGNGEGLNYGVPYNWGTRSGATVYRAQCVISSFAAALKDMNIGWDLDESYNSRWVVDGNTKIISEFYDVPFMDYYNDGIVSEEKMPGLFLKNSISGNKVFISYLCNSNRSGIWLPTEQLMSANTFNVWGPNKDRPSYVGLLISMIPGDSNQTFGSFDTNTFIPSHATRLYGTCEANGQTGGNVKSAYAKISNDSASYKPLWYSYGVLATQHCIAVAAAHSPKPASGEEVVYPEHLQLAFACGRIFGNLAHDESLPQAKYGVIQFSLANGRECFEEGRVDSSATQHYTSSNAVFDHGTTEQLYGSKNYDDYGSVNLPNTCVNLGSIFKANGAPVGFSETSNIRVVPNAFFQLSSNITSQSVGIRWIPILVSVVSTNLQNDGIVDGDGMKGFLDTDLFRCAKVEKYNTLCNGRFLSVDHNLIIGWEQTNNIL